MRRLLLLPLCLTAVLLPSPAHALSCVGHPGLTAAGLVDGSAARYDGVPVLDGFDGVLLGRVTAVSGTRPHPRHGEPVEVELEVLLGSAGLPATVTVTSSDPSWGTWQPFDEGRTYVVPYRHAGPALRSELCEPVLEVGPDALPALLAHARAQQWSTPTVTATTPAPAPLDPSDRTTATPTATATATATATGPAAAPPLLGGAVLLGAVAAVLRRHRRH